MPFLAITHKFLIKQNRTGVSAMHMTLIRPTKVLIIDKGK
jgi:hypothetical protein